MSYLAGMIVRADSTDEVADALRAAFVARGAREARDGDRLEVRIGAPIGDWVLVTDSTLHTFDTGIAEAVAGELGARVLVFGSRGTGSYGKAATKAFGGWKRKLPGSLKPSALHRLVDQIARGVWPSPWELDTRPGVTLAFDVRGMARSSGPFRTNTDSELREAEQGRQLDVTWYIANGALNNRYDTPFQALGGLRTTWGWQSAFDHVMHSVQSRSIDFTPEAARLVVALAKRAHAGLTAAKIADGWLAKLGHSSFAAIRWGMPMLCALVIDDDATWDDLAARIGNAELAHRLSIYVRSFSVTAIGELSAAARRWLDRDLPLEPALAWLVDQPDGDDTNRLLDGAVKIAVTERSPTGERVLARAADAAKRDGLLADLIARHAYAFATSGRPLPALALFDLVIDAPELAGTTYCNALWAVQSDNNKLPVDADRARRYLAACEPHGDDNPVIYLNAACVHHELGDRARTFAALAAARRHELFDQLAALRDEPMFADLVGDAEFDALTTRHKRSRPAKRRSRRSRHDPLVVCRARCVRVPDRPRGPRAGQF